MIVPAGTVTIRVSLVIKTLGAQAITTPCTVKFGRVGLYNLSSAGIPSTPAVNM